MLQFIHLGWSNDYFNHIKSIKGKAVFGGEGADELFGGYGKLIDKKLLTKTLIT